MAAGSERKYHVALAAGEVGGYVLMPGDPGRTPLIAGHLDGAREVAFNREYRTFTGSLGGAAVSTTSSGIGGPSVAIAVEELSDLGAHTFLRVGTCGALQPGIRRGDLVVAKGAVRDEGTPSGYVPVQYPAIADHDVVAACVEAARAAGAPCHTGIVRSVDALYADLLPERLPRAAEIDAEHRVWQRAGVVAQDMESSTLMVVASLKGLRAGTILLCVDEVGEGEIDQLDPGLMDRMLEVAAAAVRALIGRDRAAARQ